MSDTPDSRKGDSKGRSPQNWPLDRLPGLRREDCQALERLGVRTTLELLDRTGRGDRTQALATQLGISTHYVRKWIALSDLARVPGVGCQYCGLLLHCGIISAAQLSQTPIHKLYPQIQRLHVATMQRKDLCPPRGQVIEWIQAARPFALRR
ncbi:hypothetical protein CKA32_001808 [Geitlerinema sp. FC II]|nr:DUF4332 domain-containing protein [Geitlerinema sp. CS-897]PPT08468.1 hypothetical protein CKA32_001808 [Geitlerinema sp. FC II]